VNAPVKRHWVDSKECPEWGEGPDGRPTRIDTDARLPGLFRQWQEDACSHPEVVTVQRNDSLGRRQYFEHCKGCGISLSSAIAHAKVRNLSDFTAQDMAALEASYSNERRARYERLIRDAAERVQPSNRQSYDDYLRSDAWKRRAAKILQRANGVCEGCLSNPASEVHHLTYQNIGQEFAWELRAVCRSCHSRIHSAVA
jgi:5-methylcytosine-specific restriction endonuclease McrA